MKNICLDLDDFSVLNNRLDLLLKIKEHYPNFKVSLFTVPFDVAREVNPQARLHREGALKKIKENLSWMQFIPHGLTHMTDEMEKCDYELFKKVMISIKEAFDKDGLPFVKGFKAPYWLWNKDVVKALDDEGWWGAIDRNQPGMLKTKKTYVYSHSLEEAFHKSNLDTIKLHGHIDGVSENDLEKNFTNIFKLPTDTEWHFVTDFIT